MQNPIHIEKNAPARVATSGHCSFAQIEARNISSFVLNKQHEYQALLDKIKTEAGTLVPIDRLQFAARSGREVFARIPWSSSTKDLAAQWNDEQENAAEALFTKLFAKPAQRGKAIADAERALKSLITMSKMFYEELVRFGNACDVKDVVSAGVKK